MDITLASQNSGKIREFQKLLSPHNLISANIDVEESGLSFHENALLKARACAKNTPGIYIGDDSGIMVDALMGQPGIYSKRYKGANTNQDAIDHVIQDLNGQESNAQMVCVLALLRHINDPLPTFFIGVLPGIMKLTPTGSQGFAYDPYFYLPRLQKTNGQLTLEEKNAISHRALAAKKLLAYLNTK